MSSDADWPHWRRHQASIAHNAGEFTGAAGPVPASGFNPTSDNTPATTVGAMFIDANGPLKATGTDCAATVSACDDTGVWTSPNCCDCVLAAGPTDASDPGHGPPTLNADNRVGATEGVSATFEDTRGNAVVNPPGDDEGRPASEGEDRLPAVTGARTNGESAGNSGTVRPVCDSVCAPPVLDAIPVRGSPAAAEPAEVEPADDVEPADVPALPGTVDGNDEPDSPVEVPDEATPPVADVEPAFVADDASGVEDELEDELEADESDVDDDESGSATATPGLPATAAPTPNATANAPTRPMCLA